MLKPRLYSRRASFGRHRATHAVADDRDVPDDTPPLAHREQPHPQPLVSLVIPAYNEAAIIERHLLQLWEYVRSLEPVYRWEFIIVNDGSSDATGLYAESFAQTRQHVLVVHHLTNLGLGYALQSGFEQCQGDYVITLDLDLSYAPAHLEALLAKAKQTGATVVVASPYMHGGTVSNVPWLKHRLSVCANRFLALTAKRSLATLTDMVRLYDGQFLRGITLKSAGRDVNPEIIHKARLLQARIAEIPAHCNGQVRQQQRRQRQSSQQLLQHTWTILFSGFLIRPVMFFLLPSLAFLVLSLYASAWALIHCWTNYQQLAQVTPFPDPTDAVAQAFQQAPHTFFIGGITLMLAIQLFSLGVLALQSKSYFEEIFYLGSAIYRSSRQPKDP